jgi:hypothetical protein
LPAFSFSIFIPSGADYFYGPPQVFNCDCCQPAAVVLVVKH